MTVLASQSELVTTREVAERFGVAVSTVRRWVCDGRIPYVRVSKRTVRFDLEEVERSGSFDGGCSETVA